MRSFALSFCSRQRWPLLLFRWKSSAVTKMEKPLYLIRDVLDKLLIDSENVPLGRVDGIVLVVGEYAQPRVLQIESGTVTLARRLSTRWAHRAHRVSRWLGLRWKRPVRIDWSKVDTVGRELTLNLRGEDSPLLTRDRWLRDHIIRHIPGNRTKKEP